MCAARVRVLCSEVARIDVRINHRFFYSPPCLPAFKINKQRFNRTYLQRVIEGSCVYLWKSPFLSTVYVMHARFLDRSQYGHGLCPWTKKPVEMCNSRLYCARVPPSFEWQKSTTSSEERRSLARKNPNVYIPLNLVSVRNCTGFACKMFCPLS